MLCGVGQFFVLGFKANAAFFIRHRAQKNKFNFFDFCICIQCAYNGFGNLLKSLEKKLI